MISTLFRPVWWTPGMTRKKVRHDRLASRGAAICSAAAGQAQSRAATQTRESTGARLLARGAGGGRPRAGVTPEPASARRLRVERRSARDRGFGILEKVTPEQAGPLIARGATVDVWAAANLGMIDKLRSLIDADPARVNAKGGDGKRPLHYARTIEIAQLLLDRGAEIDALDDDHESTPAQHLLDDRWDVCAFLIARCARCDLLMASSLGDPVLVRQHLDANPAAIGMRVDQDWFPMVDTATNGGHIYQWTLGFHVSAIDVARKRDHPEVLELLLQRAGALGRLLVGLWHGAGAAADAGRALEPRPTEPAPEPPPR